MGREEEVMGRVLRARKGYRDKLKKTGRNRVQLAAKDRSKKEVKVTSLS